MSEYRDGVEYITGTGSVNNQAEIVLVSGVFDLHLFKTKYLKQPLIIKNIGAGTVTVKGWGGATIEGSATLALLTGEAVTLISLYDKWYIA
jgi:hypothetical protein